MKRLLLGILLVGFVGAGAAFAMHLQSPVVTVDVVVIDARIDRSMRPGVITIADRRFENGEARVDVVGNLLRGTTLDAIAFPASEDGADPEEELDPDDDPIPPPLYRVTIHDQIEATTPGISIVGEGGNAPRVVLSSSVGVAMRGIRGRTQVDGEVRTTFWLAVAPVGAEHPSGFVIRARGMKGDLTPHDVTIRPPQMRRESPWKRAILRREIREHVLELRFVTPRP